MGNINVLKRNFINILDNNVIGLKPGYNYQDLDERSGIIKENTVKLQINTVIMGMGYK